MSEVKTEFEPKIIGFLCNWCSYAGADLAGVSRLAYPTNLRVIRVMCSARVDPVHILDSFLNGVDGILVGGCHLGDCHYITGNYYAEKKIELTKKLLQIAGIEEKRLRLEWVSAAEGVKFSQIVTEFTETIKNLGPFQWMDKLMELQAAKEVANGRYFRILAVKAKDFVDVGNVYGERFTKHEINRMINGIINDEYISAKIRLMIKEKVMSVKELSQQLDLPPPRIFRHITELKRSGFAIIDKIEGTTPFYKASVRESQ
ncbi:MAG: hydrogenase iron-sulfur subunit [Promethearchaeota archaeon]